MIGLGSDKKLAGGGGGWISSRSGWLLELLTELTMRWSNLSTRSCSNIIFLDMSITTHSGDFRCAIKKHKSGFLARFALKIRIGDVNVEKLETSRLHNLLMAAVLEEIFCPDACFRAEHGILVKEKGRFFQVRDVNPASGCGLRLGR